MRFTVESWDPAYGSSTDDTGLDPAKQTVDVSVEVPADAWAPIAPDPGGAPSSVLFIDGVRRIDTRVWIAEGELSRPGLCATVAAGAVRCEAGSAVVEAVVVERGLYTAADDASPIRTRTCGTYALRPVHGDDDPDLYLGVHNHMTHLEALVSERAVNGGSTGCQLIVFDGPLRQRDDAIGVGYIKTQHVQYLEDGLQQRTLAGLRAAQRTPLFAIGVGGRSPRWSWYLRLPGPVRHPLEGIVRLELPGIGDAETAAARADAVSAALPRFASEAHKEARAPQNLYPIAGLEQQLRRRLGHPHLLEKALREASLTVAEIA
ncbi:MAG: hypothetical protein OEV40_01965 [Acidimicrobiia bacterium]|nr:hypothetical protein [Acidimicrobiia bacterium]